jgi:hypothetical protein
MIIEGKKCLCAAGAREKKTTTTISNTEGNYRQQVAVVEELEARDGAMQ